MRDILPIHTLTLLFPLPFRMTSKPCRTFQHLIVFTRNRSNRQKPGMLGIDTKSEITVAQRTAGSGGGTEATCRDRVR